MTYWMLIIIYAVCFLPVAVMFVLLPYIGRKTLCFGVSIPSGEFKNEQLVRLRKRFAVTMMATGTALTAAYIVLLSFVSAETAVFIMAAILLLYIAAVSAAYVCAWRKVLAIKESSGWEAAHEIVVADTHFRKKRRAVSPAWFVLYALIIIATALIGLLLYDGMPDNIIQKIDFQGNVVQTMPKSVGVICFAPAMQAFISIIFALVYWMLLRTPPVLDPDNPETTSRQNAVSRRRWSAYTVFGGMIMLLMFVIMQLGFTQVIGTDIQLWAPLLGAGALVIGAMITAITTGQSGSRVKTGRSTDRGEIRRDDDRYWKWGGIYVNRDDPTLFVEKRFGIGFTMNFGRPAAMAVTAGLVLIIAASIVAAALLVK